MTQARGRVLVTGGAGFIGSHVVDRLLARGYAVRVLDALLPQVHASFPPDYLNPEAELLVGDVRDRAMVKRALEGVETLLHLAAAVGVGQSMYQIEHFTSANVMGTATLLEALVRDRPPLRRIVVASSMSLYGEGLFACPADGPQAAPPRPAEQLERRDWSVHCPRCGAAMDPRPTPETKPLIPTSIYAINKRDHEEMTLVAARSLGISAVALRFFNVYGARQALSNPYTGVAAIFSSALLNGQRPLVFEDGLQGRDFVHVSDIAEACALAAERTDVADEVLNVGTGEATDLLTLFDLLRREIAGAAGIEPQILGKFREGDIRSCYADISRIRERLGYEPRVALRDGVRELAAWVASQTSRSLSAQAYQELEAHRLVR
ncbi:MAG TPA: NAD-dependent epimerase/dehydratase family protein [Vicinamibacteria bacterium]|nr:NAD-dependent epimerase/dehydratase family protein [Vicinamibacteria bacterium]